MAPAPDPAPAPAPAPAAAAAAAGCFLTPSARLSPLSFGYWASGWLAGWVRTAPHRTAQHRGSLGGKRKISFYYYCYL